MNLFRKFRMSRSAFAWNMRSFGSPSDLPDDYFECESLFSENPKISKTAKGVTVASVENYNPLSYIAITLKAGTRYETGHNLGIVHTLRNCSVLSTKNRTAFALTRNLELHGCKVRVISTREHMIYSLQCLRDHVDFGLEYLFDIVLRPALKPWEVQSISENLFIDLLNRDSNKASVLMEMLHKAAFKNGMRNPLYCEPFMIGKHTVDMLQQFLIEHYSTTRTSVVGIGVGHEYLVERVEKLLDLPDDTGNPVKFAKSMIAYDKNKEKIKIRKVDGKMNAYSLIKNIEWFSKSSSEEPDADAETAKFEDEIRQTLKQKTEIVGAKFWSGQVRREADSKFVHAAIASEGINLSNSKDLLSLAVLQCVLGSGKRIGCKLGEEISKSVGNPFHVSCININYSDTGLFGMYVIGDPYDMNNLLKEAVSQLKTLLKNISQKDLEIGKHKLKAKLLMEKENTLESVISMSIEAAERGTVQNTKDLLAKIDELKIEEIESARRKVMKGKPAMAALGRLHSTPYTEDLI